jgi:DNA-binding SARP family transcriptional activator
MNVTVWDQDSLRVEVLGPVRAWRGERELPLGGPRQRTVFAVLAVRAGQVVSHAELTDALWGQDPPASAASSIYTYVTGLRRALEPGRPRRSSGQVLVSAGSGYLLKLDDGELDADVFYAHRARAQRQRGAGDLRGAAQSFDAALRLWRGVPFGTLSGPFAEIERARLGELRLTMHEERADVLLALGRHAALTVELPGLIQENPLREGLRRELMLALYRSGRQAEALAVYRDTRATLVAELGIEPGPELRQLQEQILVMDPALDLAGPPGPGTRAADLDRLDQAATELATAVTRQWTAEVEMRSLLRPHPVQLRWSSTGRPVAAAASAVLGREPGISDPKPLSLRGDLTDLVAKFRQLPKRQLVVLGEPGAGKTVLAMLLTLGLLNDLQPGEAAPVLLPLSSWNPQNEHLHTWFARRLTEEYPGLANAAAYGPHAAQRLVTDGRILPVLDGLDEAPPALHAAAIDAVDQAIAGGRPLVVTCRSAEYTEAVLRGGTILATAAVVEIEPVGLSDAAVYLTARQPPGDRRWQPVVEQLHRQPAGPLAQALSTALMVDLARTAYSTPGTDPAELCDPIRFPDRASIEGHLLDAFLPAVYASRPPPPSPAGPFAVAGAQRAAAGRYQPGQAQRWLTFLAGHLERRHARDFAWWQLTRAIPRPIQGLLFGLPAAVLFAVAGELAGGWEIAAVYGIALALAGCTAHAVGRRPGPARVEMRFRGTAARFLGRFGVGLVIGIALGLSWALPFGLIAVLIAVFGLCLGAQVWLDTPAEANRVSSPLTVLKQDRAAAVSFTLSFALSLGTFYGVADAFTKQIRFLPVLGGHFDLALALAAGLAGGLLGRFAFGRLGGVAYGVGTAAFGGMVFPRAATPAAGLMAGAVFGLAVGLTIFLSRAWGSFMLSLAWFGARGRVPLRLVRFLDDAHRRGVLRQVGAVYQFRHARLQDQLMSKPNR